MASVSLIRSPAAEREPRYPEKVTVHINRDQSLNRNYFTLGTPRKLVCMTQFLSQTNPLKEAISWVTAGLYDPHWKAAEFVVWDPYQPTTQVDQSWAVPVPHHDNPEKRPIGLKIAFKAVVENEGEVELKQVFEHSISESGPETGKFVSKVSFSIGESIIGGYRTLVITEIAKTLFPEGRRTGLSSAWRSCVSRISSCFGRRQGESDELDTSFLSSDAQSIGDGAAGTSGAAVLPTGEINDKRIETPPPPYSLIPSAPPYSSMPSEK